VQKLEKFNVDKESKISEMQAELDKNKDKEYLIEKIKKI